MNSFTSAILLIAHLRLLDATQMAESGMLLFFEYKNPIEVGIYAPAHRNEYYLAAPFYGTEQKKTGLLTRRPDRTVHRPRGRLRGILSQLGWLP